MPTPKPPGFDTTYRIFSILLKTDSEIFDAATILASFSFLDGTTRKFYRGVKIDVSTAAADATITTTEPHGFIVGDIVRIIGHGGAILNAEHKIGRASCRERV